MDRYSRIKYECSNGISDVAYGRALWYYSNVKSRIIRNDDFDSKFRSNNELSSMLLRVRQGLRKDGSDLISNDMSHWKAGSKACEKFSMRKMWMLKTLNFKNQKLQPNVKNQNDNQRSTKFRNDVQNIKSM